MASKLNNTMETAKHAMESAKEGAEHAVGTAKHAMESAKEGTEHAVSSARSTFLDGVHAVSGVLSLLRSFDADDALALAGLARRRSPLLSAATFGAGVAVGAGVGMLFAPMSGADLRREIVNFFKGVKHEAKETLERAESEVKDFEDKTEELAGKAKDAVKKAERKVENKVAEGVEAVKEGVKHKVEAMTSAVKNAAEDAKSTVAAKDLGYASDSSRGEASKFAKTHNGPGEGVRLG